MKLAKILILVGSLLVFSSFAFGIWGDYNSNRVAIVVNKYLKQEIEDNLNIYLQDLKNEGYNPILKEWDLENNPAPQMLKAYLKRLYLEEEGLQGAVFIGDLPIAIMDVNFLSKRSMSSVGYTNPYTGLSEGYIAESYYMDLQGREWTDSDKNYKVEEPDYQSYWKSFLKAVEYYTPEKLKKAIGKTIVEERWYAIPEIWTSRIVASTVTRLLGKSEGKLINTYLQKNHAYRTGQVIFEKQVLLYSLPNTMKHDFAFSSINFTTIRDILSKKYELKEPISAPETIDEFFKLLNSGSYEIFYWARHGMKISIDIGGQDLTSIILVKRPVNIRTAFVFPASCWIGHYIEPAYFAGSYLFNEKYYVLGMPTSTLPEQSNPEILMMSEFVDGENLGLAFKKAMEMPDFSQQNDARMFLQSITNWHARYILGDGTLRLQSTKLIENDDNSPQKYLKEKYSYNEEFGHDNVKSKEKTAETGDKEEF